MDKIEKLAQARENLVDDIELRHTNRLNIALENLERDVVKIANDLPTRKGKLFGFCYQDDKQSGIPNKECFRLVKIYKWK